MSRRSFRTLFRPTARAVRRRTYSKSLRFERLEMRATPAVGLVAAYAFNEGGGGTVSDASGNLNTGTITNAAWTTAGRFGNALSFNGTSALVTVNSANSLNLTSGMTLEAWVRPTKTLTDWSTVVMKERSGGLAYTLYGGSPGSGPAGYITRTGTTSDIGALGPAALASNTWTYLAATYDGTTIRIYVNGAQVGSQAAAGTITTSTNPLRIGGNGVWGEYFTGLIDEVRIYNRTLAASEIQTDMNTPVPSSATLAATVKKTTATSSTVSTRSGSTATSTPTRSVHTTSQSAAASLLLTIQTSTQQTKTTTTSSSVKTDPSKSLQTSAAIGSFQARDRVFAQLGKS